MILGTIIIALLIAFGVFLTAKKGSEQEHKAKEALKIGGLVFVFVIGVILLVIFIAGLDLHNILF